MIGFSCVIATNGQPSLTRAIECLGDSGLGAEDEILLAIDADSPPSADVMEVADAARPLAHMRVVRSTEPGGDYGAAARRCALRHCRKSYIIFCDDDDRFLPGALSELRVLLEERPVGVYFVKMEFRGGGVYEVLPRDGQVRRTSVGGEQIVVPNIPAKIGDYGTSKMKPEHAVDWLFIESTLKKWGGRHEVLDLLAVEHNGLVPSKELR